MQAHLVQQGDPPVAWTIHLTDLHDLPSSLPMTAVNVQFIAVKAEHAPKTLLLQ